MMNEMQLTVMMTGMLLTVMMTGMLMKIMMTEMQLTVTMTGILKYWWIGGQIARAFQPLFGKSIADITTHLFHAIVIWKSLKNLEN